MQTYVLIGHCTRKPLTPVNDQDRISPYYIYTISCKQEMRMMKNISIIGLLIDLLPNSPQ